MQTQLTYRIDDLSDPVQRRHWAVLLHDIFGADFTAFLALDVWPTDYRSFAYMDGDVIAANVSLEPLPLMVAGKRIEGGQIQSVATRPFYRRRGLFSDLMQRMLASAHTQYECLLLTTTTPDLYHPFGFRPLPQYRFIGSFPDAACPTRSGARLLSPDQPDDIAMIRRLFANRLPVSDVFSPCANEGIFIAMALLQPEWRLSYLSDDDALVVWDEHHGTRRLLDIVAERMPAAATLAQTLQVPPARLSRSCFRQIGSRATSRPRHIFPRTGQS